jgi:serine/threonine protein kinase
MKAGVFREEYIAILARELLRGLEYLHGEGKLHRDIKGELSRDIMLIFSRQHLAYSEWRW